MTASHPVWRILAAAALIVAVVWAACADFATPAAANAAPPIQDKGGGKATPQSVYSGAQPDAANAASGIRVCASTPPFVWQSSSTDWQVVGYCQITTAAPGYVFMQASGYLWNATQPQPYTAQFTLSIDDTAASSQVAQRVDRKVTINPNGGAQLKTLADNVIAPVEAGTHTYYLLGKLAAGAGPTYLTQADLSVVFVPSSTSQLMRCSATPAGLYYNDTTSFERIATCNLTTPQDGYALMVASAWVNYESDPYEAEFIMGIDDTPGALDNSRRYVNMYNAGSAYDPANIEAVGTNILTPVAAGTHQFWFSTRRSNGIGASQGYDPSLSVLWISNTAADIGVSVCGAASSSVTVGSDSGYVTLASCNMSAASNGAALLSASTSVFPGVSATSNGMVRAQLEKNGAALAQGFRLVTTGPDGGDGIDRSIMSSGLVPVSAGSLLFEFTSQPDYSMTMIGPSLSVILINNVTVPPQTGITPTITAGPSPTFTTTPATATRTRTRTITRTPTATRTRTITKTPTRTATRTKTPTRTATRTKTPTRTATKTKTRTPTVTRTRTPTRTRTRTMTPTRTRTPLPPNGQIALPVY